MSLHRGDSRRGWLHGLGPVRARASVDDRWSCDISVSFPCAPGAGASRGMDPVPSIARAGRRPRLPEPRQSIARSRYLQTFFVALPRDSVHVAQRLLWPSRETPKGSSEPTMAEHARAVIIGGGVGGTSIAYHLAERGWTDIVLVDRAELTSGSTFHSAGLVGQLRSSRDADQDDDVRRPTCTGGSRPRPAPTRRGTRSARSAWRRRPERFEELRRQAGWAKTFGLPLELITAERGAGPLPADVDRRRPRRRLAADRRLARPVRPRQRAGRRRARSAAPGSGRSTGSSRSARRPRPGHRRRRSSTAASGPRSAPTSWSTPAACSRRRSAGWPASTSRSSRWPTSTSSPSRSRASTRACRSSATRTTSSTSARRSAGCAWAATSATRRRGRSTASRPTSTASCWRPTGSASSRDHGRRDPARPGDGRRGRQPGHQRARGVHARTTSSSSASREVRGFFVAAGFCAHGIAGRGRDRPPGGDAGSSTASPSSTSGRWTSGGSGRPTAARPTRWPGRSRTTRPTTTSTTRTRSARPAGRCGCRRPTTVLAGLGAAFGEKSGWERPNWFESNAAGRRRGAPTARLGRRALVAGDRRRGAGDAAGGRPVRRDARSPRSRSSGPGAVAFLQRLCANDVDVPVGRIVYTQLLNRRGGIECDLTVTRVTADRFLIVTGTAFGKHDLGWLRRAPARRRQRAAQRHDLGPRLLRAVGPAGARHPRLRSRATTSPTPASRTSPRAPITVGSVPVFALRVTYVGELGWELYAHTEYGAGAVADAVGGRAGRTAWSPAATGRSTRSGSRRATASGRATSPRTRRRSRPASGSPSRSTRRPSSSAATRSSRPRRPGRASACAASSSTIRARSASATSRSGSTARSSAG